MNSNWKTSVTPFLAGCIVTGGILASQGAIGTSGVEPATEQLVNKVVSDTTQAVLLSLEQQEKEQLDKIPDPLDCNSFSWMESCEAINRQSKQNPSAPIRVKRQDGVEFNFPPGTPSYVMNAMLDDSEKATKAMIDQLDAVMGHHNKMASRFQSVLWAQGGLVNAEISADKKVKEIEEPRESIDTDTVAIRFFYDSRCSACKISLRNLDALKERYPDLNISGFQFNDNPKELERIKKRFGIPARILNETEVSKLRGKGMNTVPTLWIDNTKEKHRLSREGAFSLSVLEDELERLSQFKSGGRG